MWYIAKVNRTGHDRWVTLQKVGTPKNWITYCVKTDGIAYRELLLTGEVCYCDATFFFKEVSNFQQVERQEGKDATADGR